MPAMVAKEPANGAAGSDGDDRAAVLPDARRCAPAAARRDDELAASDERLRSGPRFASVSDSLAWWSRRTAHGSIDTQRSLIGAEHRGPRQSRTSIRRANREFGPRRPRLRRRTCRRCRCAAGRRAAAGRRRARGRCRASSARGARRRASSAGVLDKLSKERQEESLEAILSQVFRVR